MSRQLAAVVQLQLITGARPTELLRARPIDFDMTGDVWILRPAEHKTLHHGHQREVFFGPRSQALVRPFLAQRAVDARLFDPEEAEAERHERQRETRKTPVTPSQKARAALAVARGATTKPSSCYDVAGYRRAIARACVRAGVPQWHPHQLRHNAGTNIRRQHGIETARVLLGHKSAGVTEVYAEADQLKAIDIAKRFG